jgi:CHASE2 domain-containing sensor protein/signal transduction histidine kinase
MSVRFDNEKTTVLLERLAVLLVGLLLLLILQWWSPVKGLRLGLYDFLQSHSPAQNHPDIVVIGIDDDSLAALGGWPLSRSRYAQLLQKLSLPENKPRAVGIDLLFVSPTRDDAQLAEAMRGLPVVLAEQPQEKTSLPLADNASASQSTLVPQLRLASAGVGHVALFYDSDGELRNLPPSFGGVAHFSVAMLQAGGRTSEVPNRASPLRMRLISPNLQYPTLSLKDALSPETSLTWLKDKWVLVGVTSPTLGDMHATRDTGENQLLLPGVMILASALSTHLRQDWIQTVSPEVTVTVNGLLLVALFVLLLRWPPHWAVPLAVVLLFAFLLAAYLALHVWNWWLNVAPLLLATLLLCLYWLWRKLALVMHFMRGHVQGWSTLDGERPQLPDAMNKSLPHHHTGDAVQDTTARLAALMNAQQQQLHMLDQLLLHLPEALAVFDGQEALVLGNARLRALAPASLCGAGAKLVAWQQWMGLPPIPQDQWAQDLSKNPQVLHTWPSLQGPRTGYVRLQVLSNRQLPDLSILSFQDVTELRQSQAERDLAVQFLSHDLRAPIASILSLLEAPFRQSSAQELDGVRMRIQRHARQLLEGMDGFLLHHRAHRTLSLEEHLLDDLIHEALIQVRDMAAQRGMALQSEAGPEGVFVQADAALMVRALLNLLMNAIVHGEPNMPITLGHHIDPSASGQMGTERWVRVWVRNAVARPVAQAHVHGSSVASAHLPIRGFGLGLSFVAQVMVQHKGQVLRDIPDVGKRSATGDAAQWACVSLLLPCELEPLAGA